MKISVVTVCFNAEDTIGATIESVLAQSHAEWEHLIIDGASRDRTLDVVRRYSDRRIIVLSEPDDGLYDAMNKGLDRFAGDGVGFLNADDRFHDEHALAAIAEGLSRADVVYGDLDFVTDHACHDVVRRWRSSDWTPGAFRRGWMPAHPTFYVQRNVVDEIGRFNCELRIAADYDFMLRCLERRATQAERVDRVLVDMKIGGQSTATPYAYLQGNLEALASRRRWLGAGVVDYALFAKPLGKLGQWSLKKLKRLA